MTTPAPQPDRARVEQALAGVIDPELGLAITELGLVRDISLAPGHCRVALTMTSASCPMGGLIVDDATQALQRALGPDIDCRVELQFEPPWTPAEMSERARQLLGA